ncbi:MAG TPA: AMIN domain-containing protein [bacterium]|nr:AMIN domain-containing protein [bacterium]
MRGEWHRDIPAGLRLRREVIGIFVIIGLVAWASAGAGAARVKVSGITSHDAGTEIQVTIAASGPIGYQLRHIQPSWIVLDIPNVDLGMPAGNLSLARGPLQKVRVGQPTANVVRVVLELTRPVEFLISTAPDQKTIVVSIPIGLAGGAQGGGDFVPSVPKQEPAAQRTAPRGAQGGGDLVPAVPKQEAVRAVAPIWDIIPGKNIGPIKLGMDFAEASKILGPQVSSRELPNGNVIHRWFSPPKNAGLGVLTTKLGRVIRIWALNDRQYTMRGRIHAGSTEAEVRAVLGNPTNMVVNSSAGDKTLRYDSLGLWIGIQLDKRFTFFNQVYEIVVM